MKCTRNIPEECFTCPFPDCKADNNPNLQERLYLRVEPEKPSRAEYFAEYYKNLSPEQKARKKAKAKEWTKLHRKEITIRRREYFREYAAKNREKIRMRAHKYYLDHIKKKEDIQNAE